MMNDQTSDLISGFQHIVGRRYVLTKKRHMERYCKGFRSGSGSACAVLLPGCLIEQWRILELCVKMDVAIIMQAANTGLTEGSTPSGHDYDRKVVIINTLRMDRIDLIDDGKQIISLPGATLFQLENLLKPLKRQPHSVIGSSCVGASIVGGVSNNSGGSLIQRGPAYTELSLFARVNEAGKLVLINHLGIKLGDSPEEILGRLDRQDYTANDIQYDQGVASDQDYAQRVRDITAETPARFNADPRRLHESSGSAGKLAIFAVRLDTFPVEQNETVFYIGTNNPENLTRIRREILGSFDNLPVAGEYLHRDAFAITQKYGKDIFVLIDKLGTQWMPRFFALKGYLDSLFNNIALLPRHLTDRFLQALFRFWPEVLPKKILQYHKRFEHHLMIKTAGNGVEETRQYFENFTKNLSAHQDFSWFECTPEEGRKAFLHRFATAGAAIRYGAVHQSVGDIIALDIALPRNNLDWQERLEPELDQACVAKLYYGHFFCYVFHQDYILHKNFDQDIFKERILTALDKRHAEYPAEHNVGHIYKAKPELEAFYKKTDPCNVFNPGIGKASKFRYYGCQCAENPTRNVSDAL